MAKFFWSLRCQNEGVDKTGIDFSALQTSTDNPPTETCPTNGAHIIVANSLRLIKADAPGRNESFKTALAHFFTGNLSTTSTTYVSSTGRKGDFFFDPDQWSKDVIFRVQIGCKRDAASTVASAEFRIVKMNDDDTEGAVVGADPFVQINFSNDDVQKIVSGDLAPSAGKAIYRFQAKKTGGAGGQGITIIHFSILAVLPN